MVDTDTEGLGYFNLIPSSCLAIGEETNVEKQTPVYVTSLHLLMKYRGRSPQWKYDPRNI